MNSLEHVKSLVDEIWSHPDKFARNLEEAERQLRALAQADPSNQEVLTCLGAVLSDRGKHGEAASILRKAIDLGSEDRHTYFNMAVALINFAHHEDAMEYFTRANSRLPSPRTWEAYFDPQAH